MRAYRKCYIKDTLCYIPLQNDQEAITDAIYFDKVSKYIWHLTANNYVAAHIENKIVYLQKLLFPEMEKRIKFINENKLDCRKENIQNTNRICYIKDNICYIPLQNGKLAICDADRFAEVSQHIWLISKGYVISRINNKNVFLHRFLNPQWKIIDHINRNPLDNTSINLREVTNQQNSVNSSMPINNTSGYKGVTKRNNKWYAQINYNDKHYYLGYHDTPEQAALAYNEKAKELFGEYAYLNVIGENK